MSDWGQGTKNNNIGWGQGAVNNDIDWGLYHKDENSWSGDTEIYGISLTDAYSARVIADGGTIEGLECVRVIVNNF